MTKTVGMIGLGSMGGGMTVRLLETGHSVLGYDPLPEACDRTARAGADIAKNLGEVGVHCEFIILSLPAASHVNEVMTELGRLLPQGTVVLDTTTSDPETSRALAKNARAKGYEFLDGPVSGGPSGARSGTMTMVVGGEPDGLNRVRPVLGHLTAKLLHIGPSGAGNTVKIANNLLCAANLVLVSEMARLAERAGLSPGDLLSGVNAGSGRSAVSEVNFPRWILNDNFDSGFTMGLMRKDVGLAGDLAAQFGLDLPATRAVAAIWEDSRKMLPDSADFNEIYTFEGADE